MTVDKALEKDPADRYQTMREFVVDLRRMTRQSESPTMSVTARVSHRRRILYVGLAVVAALGPAAAWFFSLRTTSTPVGGPLEMRQITAFTDSATQPSHALDYHASRIRC